MIEATLFHPDTYEIQQETQRLAAARDRTTDLLRVKALMLEHPEGLTDWDIADLLGEPVRKASLGRRRAQLGAEKVRDADGEPVKRTCHGSSCFVWVLP